MYEVDVYGHLYALSPAGDLEWIFNGAGPKGVDVGPDGTIYTGDESAIIAVNPDGTLKWSYVENPRAFILLGPNVGPDGNIYAVGSEGLGVFSLTPKGQLRWNVPERYDRLIVDYQEITFGKAPGEWQLYFHANKHLKGFSLSGQLRFTVEGDGSQPSVAPDGTILTHTWDILHGYSPKGTPKWSFYVSPNNVHSAPDVDLNGNAYVGWNLASLYRLSRAGAQKWKFTEPDMGILNDPIVNPAGTLVLMGGQPNYGEPGYFEAVKARRGKLAWKQDLGLDPGSGQPIVPFSRSRFSSDGTRAFASAIVLGVYDYSFLYGLATG